MLYWVYFTYIISDDANDPVSIGGNVGGQGTTLENVLPKKKE